MEYKKLKKVRLESMCVPHWVNAYPLLSECWYCSTFPRLSCISTIKLYIYIIPVGHYLPLEMPYYSHHADGSRRFY